MKQENKLRICFYPTSFSA